MHEFDLVPNGYREFLRKWRIVGYAWRGSAIMIAIAVATVIALRTGASAYDSDIARLETRQAINTQETNAMSMLAAEKNRLLAEEVLLRSLRAGPPLVELLERVERSVTEGEVWFDHWSLARMGIVVDGAEGVLSGGYVQDAESQGPPTLPDRWESVTRMTIKGEAINHKVLSLFVQQLFQQPDVDDVKLQRSAQLSGDQIGVRFELAVLLKTPEVRS